MSVNVIAGTLIEAKGTFKDADGVVFDPDVVECYLEDSFKNLLTIKVSGTKVGVGEYVVTLQTPVEQDRVVVVFEGTNSTTDDKYFGRTLVQLPYHR